MDSASEFRLVLVTAADSDEAADMAHKLITENLCACVNIVSGVRSLYPWKGQIHDESEVLMVIKTTAACLELLEKRLLELHKYENPEVLSLKLDSGTHRYLNWLQSSIDKGS